MKKRIVMLDGDTVLGEGEIQDFYLDFVHGDPETGTPREPDFDINRLSYQQESYARDALTRIRVFAQAIRQKVVGEPDAMRRDGWTTKAVLAVVTVAISDPEHFKTHIAPVILNSFGEEAKRRGQGETAEQLMLSSITKMLQMHFATSLVEGYLRGLEKTVGDLTPEEIESLFAKVRKETAVELAKLQQ